MPLQATSGAASQDAFGGNGVAVVPTYIEDVFSTFLYTGTGANQTITNNIDLSTNGGLVWIKQRSLSASHRLFDTARGVTKYLASNGTGASATDATSLTAFNSTGFSLGDNSSGDDTVNGSTYKYVSWTFRKQPKFFDVVTYTGTGSAQNVAHALGSVPACIIIKRTDTTGTWIVYHRSLPTPETNGLHLNATTAQQGPGITGYWDSTLPTSTVFTVNTNASLNASGGTYVAYIFAHDAGGFGLTGTDNVISCGGFTTDGSGNATVNLGYEPQWILTKRTNSATDWQIYDNMRGFTADNVAQNALRPNTNTAESGSFSYATNSTGFSLTGVNASDTFIYIAIRRPMKVPTTGTSVFATVARTGTGAAATVTAGFPVDMYLMQRRPNHFPNIVDRLRGNTRNIQTYQTDAETTITDTVTGFDNMTAALVGADTSGYVNQSAITYVNQMFRRAPSFMDVVCYTGTGSATTFSHNLQAVPELMIVKERNGANGWQVYSAALTNTDYLILNTTAGTASSATRWNSTTPTSTVFSVGTHGATNGSGQNFVNYLFATCAGVSKVGSYTGTGTTLQINCGFTAGARFVLIKRTDSTGDWYVWDTARGIIAGNDPYLLLNSTAAEVTNTDYIDTYSAGFEISSTAPAAINASAGTFLFLAIA
jgi:hypothetical protein